VHGTLADYRLQRLIKYSFYKNITFAFMFFFYQAFNGVSGQVSPPIPLRF
jgi:phospholipid-transporting ATPase